MHVLSIENWKYKITMHVLSIENFQQVDFYVLLTGSWSQNNIELKSIQSYTLYYI